MDFHKGNFHETIRDAIASLAGSYGKYANWTSAKQTIRDAIRNVVPEEMAEDYIHRYTPEYYLDGEWNQCLIKYGSKVEQILHNRLIPDIPHDYHKNEVSLDIARIRIKNIIETWFETTSNRTMMLNVTPGTGKSHEALSFLQRKMDSGEIHFAWYLTPTVELAEEQAKSFGATAQVIRGRTKEDPSGNPMCKRRDLIQNKQQNLNSIYKTFCQNSSQNGSFKECPHKSNCLYIQQFSQRNQPTVYFMSHAYACNQLHEDLRLPTPDLVIIDESILSTLIEKEDVPVSRFLKDSGEYSQVAEIILDELKAGRAPFKQLQIEGYDKYQLLQAQENLNKQTNSHFDPSLPDQQLEAKISYAQRNKAAYIFGILANEFPMMNHREQCYGVQYNGKFKLSSVKYNGETINATTEMLMVQSRRTLQIPEQARILILDATGDPEFLKPAFPEIEFHEIHVQQNLKVIQTYGFTGSKYSLIERKSSFKKVEEINNFLKILNQSSEKGFVITHKDFKDKLDYPKHWKSGHFNAVRGLNQFNECDIGVIIGRCQPTVEEIERNVKALFYDQPNKFDFLDEEASDFPWEPKGHWLRNGDRMGSLTKTHPDSICNALFQQTCESEIVQAIGRLRAVHSENSKMVFILTNVPIPMEVDLLQSYQFLLRNHALHVLLRNKGVFPHKPKWLAKCFPEYWKNENSAKCSLKSVFKALHSKQLKSSNSLISIYYTDLTLLNFTLTAAAEERLGFIEFRLLGEKKYSKCYTIYEKTTTHQYLTGLFGTTQIEYKHNTESTDIADDENNQVV
jgi:hypothetical protein